MQKREYDRKKGNSFEMLIETELKQMKNYHEIDTFCPQHKIKNSSNTRRPDFLEATTSSSKTLFIAIECKNVDDKTIWMYGQNTIRPQLLETMKILADISNSDSNIEFYKNECPCISEYKEYTNSQCIIKSIKDNLTQIITHTILLHKPYINNKWPEHDINLSRGWSVTTNIQKAIKDLHTQLMETENPDSVLRKQTWSKGKPFNGIFFGDYASI